MVRVVNTNVQSPIPLQGKGFTQRESKNYESGEYPELNNVFVKANGLESRYGVEPLTAGSYTSALAATRFYTDLMGFIGSTGSAFGEALWVGGKNCFFTVYNQAGASVPIPGYDPESLMAGQTNTKFHVPVKVAKYQNITYQFLMKANETTGAISSYDYQWVAVGNPATVPAGMTAIVNRVAVADALASPWEQDFVDAFFWKDRMWLVTKNQIYWSGIGTANFNNFTAPVGGFVKYNSRIRSVEHLKDSLYIFCETEAFVLTYNSDPNTDAVNIQISTTVGADSSCVHEGTVYATDGYYLYSVTNNSMSKIMDLELFVRNPQIGFTLATKLVAYKNKIVLIYYWPFPFNGGSGTVTPWFNRGQKRPIDSQPNSSYAGNAYLFGLPTDQFSNVFFIDMDNASVTRFVFRDQRSTINGYITDAVVINDDRGVPKLYFMTSAVRSNSTTYNFLYAYSDRSQFYENSYNRANKQHDSYYSIPDAGGSITLSVRAPIPFCATILKYFPDGNQYLMKKFRSLLVQGNLPTQTAVAFNYGTAPYETDTRKQQSVGSVVGSPDGQQVYPKSFRFAINQRSRFLSLGIFRSDDGPAITQDDPAINEDTLNVEDVRVLWTYTGKGINTKSGTFNRK